MARLLIRGGRILDPACDMDESAELLIEEGRIAAIGPELDARGAEIVDAVGCWVAPGFVDLHTHLREPGEYGERAAFLAPDTDALALEARLDRYGVLLQQWIYHHILPHRRFALHIWGVNDLTLPAFSNSNNR